MRAASTFSHVTSSMSVKEEENEREALEFLFATEGMCFENEVDEGYQFTVGYRVVRNVSHSIFFCRFF